MQLTLTVIAENPQEMAAVLQTLGGNTLVTVQTPTIEKKASKPVVKEQPAPTVVEEKAASIEPAADTNADNTVTMEHVREAATRKIQEGKRDMLAALLKECQAGKVTDLKPAQYGYFLDKVNAL